jgi:26S proteasome regulatory subunit N12
MNLKASFLRRRRRVPSSASTCSTCSHTTSKPRPFYNFCPRIAQYHTEIELISEEDLANNIYIKVPVSLENSFVQGSYQKILSTKQNMPLLAYHFFIDKFEDTIRKAFARSAERAYESLKLVDAQKMFMIPDQKELLQFIARNNMEETIGWEVRGDRLYFVKERKEIDSIPATKMINHALEYATELNRII